MVGLMLLIFELSCCFSGAYGTSTFLLSGSGVDGRFPNMPFSAFPPYPLVTSRRYHFWSQTAVQRAIPLRGDFRMKRSKIIETGQNAPARTIWAGGAFHGSGSVFCSIIVMSSHCPRQRTHLACKARSSISRKAVPVLGHSIFAGRSACFGEHWSDASTERSAPSSSHGRCRHESGGFFFCPN